jgi:hypothetical protein
MNSCGWRNRVVNIQESAHGMYQYFIKVHFYLLAHSFEDHIPIQIFNWLVLMLGVDLMSRYKGNS